MGQYVIEFLSGSVDEVFNVLDGIVRPVRSVCVSAGAELEEIDYREFSGEFSGVLSELKSGSILSAVAHSVGKIRYGLIACPHFNGQPCSLWMGTIEVAEDWQSTWNQVLKSAGLQVACVGLEEGIDLSDQSINIDTFPWNTEGLLAGAVRGPDGAWCNARATAERQ